MRRKRLPSILLSAILSVSMAFSPIAGVPVFAAEEAAEAATTAEEAEIVEEEIAEPEETEEPEELKELEEESSGDETSVESVEEEPNEEESAQEYNGSSTDESYQEESEEEITGDVTDGNNEDEPEDYADEEIEAEDAQDPAMANADNVIASGDCSATDDDHVTWTLTGTEDEMTLIISGSGKMAKFTYPRMLDCPWFNYRQSIRNIIIEEGVLNIGNCAFSNCSKVTSIEFPAGITSIDYMACSGCYNLTSITIPNSLTSIATYAFRDVFHLTDIYFLGSKEEWDSTKIQKTGNEYFFKANIHFNELYLKAELPEEQHEWAYTGESILPKPIVTNNKGDVLTEGTDYNLAYENNSEPGTAGILINGIGDYVGQSATVEFIIKKTVEAELSQNLYYFDSANGDYQVFKPQPIVTSGGAFLSEKKDYTVEYKNNTSPGEATVIVTGTGDYAGTVELPFYLATASGLEEDYEYTGEEIMPTFTLTADKELQEGSDYSVSYEENKEPGKECPRIVVNGRGDYTGKLIIPFIIKPRAISQLSSKTGTQREINIKFEEHPCADGYIVEWRYEEDSEDKEPEHREIDADSLTIKGGNSKEKYEITTDDEGNRWCEFHGDSMPRAKHAVIQVQAYAEVNMPDGTVNYVKSELPKEVTVATGNQVIRKEMWGFTNTLDENNTKQIDVSGESHAEIYAQMTINHSIGQCFGMCWAGAYSVLYGNRFGTVSLQDIDSFDNAAKYSDSTLGMSAEDAIAYAQAIQQASINMEEWDSAYLGDDISNAVGNRNFFQQFYDRVKACQSGNGDPILITLNGRNGNYHHAVLAMGVSYEDDRIVEIDVYDPNCGNKATENFKLYKANGSLTSDNASFAYTTVDNTLITGELSDYDQLITAPADFWIMPVNQNLRELLNQVRNGDVLTLEDSLLFSYVPETQEGDYIFEMNEGDSSTQIVPSYYSDSNQLIFRVTNPKGKKLFLRSRKATIKFGIRNIEYEIIIKMDEPCEIEITVDNPSYPSITINDAGIGQDVGWLERRFENGSLKTSSFNLVAGADGTISLSPQPDTSTLFSGISAISVSNMNGTYDGNCTINEKEITSMPAITLLDSDSYRYSLYNNNPLLKQIAGDEADSSTIVFHVHDWSKWNTTKEPTVDEEGTEERNCGLCGEKETQDIARLIDIKTSNVTGISNKTYTGKACTQSLTVTLNSDKLAKGTDYTVSYKNNINVGTAMVTITGIGKYTGKVTKTFKITQAANKITGSNYTRSYSTKAQTLTLNAKATGGKLTYKSNKSAVKVTSKGKVTIAAKFSGTATITVTAGNSNYKTVTKKIYVVVPTKTTLSSVKSPAAGKMKITWKKNTAVTGYQIQYSLKSSFASPKTKTISKNSQIATTISSLAKGKKYYVRIRSFKTVSGKKYYSAWSAAKATTIKK